MYYRLKRSLRSKSIVGIIRIALVVCLRIDYFDAVIQHRPVINSAAVNYYTSIPSGGQRTATVKSAIKQTYVRASERFKTDGERYERDYGFRSIDMNDFYRLRVDSRVIVDKSLLIRDVLLSCGTSSFSRSSSLIGKTNLNRSNSTNSITSKVVVWNHPRGYGKSVNMDMLRRFLEIEVDSDGRLLDERERRNNKLFVGGTVRSSSSRFPIRLKPLKIVRYPDCMKYRGKFPVIFFSFERLHGDTFEETLKNLNGRLMELLNKYDYVVRKNDYYPKLFLKLNRSTSPDDNEFVRTDYVLRFLCGALRRHYKRKTIVLIDEYDTPIMNAYLRYSPYKSSVLIKKTFELFDSVVRNLLRDNDDLARLVLSGIVPIDYTTLNNNSLITDSSYFGFSPDEVDYLLEKTSVYKRPDEIKTWYYGGNITGSDVYAPWALMKCLQYRGKNLGPYWTASREKWYIQRVVQSDEIQPTIQRAIVGKSVQFRPRIGFTVDAVVNRTESLLNVLAFTGYLIPESSPLSSDERRLFIAPNEHVKFIFTNGVLNWICAKLKIPISVYYSLTDLLTGTNDEKMNRFNVRLNEILPSTSLPEIFYKGFMFSLRHVLSFTYSTPIGKIYTGEQRTPLVLLPPSSDRRNDMSVRGQALMIDYRLINSTTDLSEKSAKDCLQTLIDKRYHRKLRALGSRSVVQICVAFYQRHSSVAYKINGLPIRKKI